jgi:hypothetical protein
VGVLVGVGVGVFVAALVGVCVGVFVGVLVGVCVGVSVGVLVGDAQEPETHVCPAGQQRKNPKELKQQVVPAAQH